jgi:2-polyprenyl-6-methoxyphenol hydroxylase-like FAD-dependent oxidoreductase
MLEPDHKVVIVGAGPTGLALGAELKRLDIPSLILDRLEAGANTSHAAVVHARTLEVLEPLGITPELLQEGIVVPIFRVRDRNRILTSISFKDLETKYPFTLMCPQNRTEAILLRRLQTLGGDVLRPCEVVTVRSGENDVEVQFKCGEELKTVRTPWLIGCDGMHSVVREQASIPFLGGDYEESFVLADVDMDWPLDREEVGLFFSDKGLVVVAPLPGNHFRIVATMKEVPLGRRLRTCSTFLKSADRRTPPSQFAASCGALDFTWSRALPRLCGKEESCWPAMLRTFTAPPVARA